VRKELPDSWNSLVVRTDFSDDAAWYLICTQIEAPVGEFRARVTFLSDPDLERLTPDELTVLARRGPYRTFLFVVDGESLRNPEHPILVLDLADEPGRTFRVIPSAMWSVENNLSICNMDFPDFADSVGSDGIFRGFAGD
jgi:hypothetical protein